MFLNNEMESCRLTQLSECWLVHRYSTRSQFSKVFPQLPKCEHVSSNHSFNRMIHMPMDSVEFLDSWILKSKWTNLIILNGLLYDTWQRASQINFWIKQKFCLCYSTAFRRILNPRAITPNNVDPSKQVPFLGVDKTMARQAFVSKDIKSC